MPIPAFRPDGYLPVGLHRALEAEVVDRFGRESERRRALMARVATWLSLARTVQARRFLLDGSFVTTKPAPKDVDCACLLPLDFEEQYNAATGAAVSLYDMLVSRQPEELFGVFSLPQWEEWVDFFSQTREADGRRKGVVEVVL
jgi:hypothetical protein